MWEDSTHIFTKTFGNDWYSHEFDQMFEAEWKAYEFVLPQINPQGLIEKIELNEKIPSFNPFHPPNPEKQRLALIISLKHKPQDMIKYYRNTNK